MKKKLLILLSIMLSATSFVGCGEEDVVNNVTTTPPVVENYDNIDTSEVSEQIEALEFYESFPIPNDRDLTIYLADVPNVFRKIGDDISIFIHDVSVYRADGTRWDLGYGHTGNLYYSSEYNLLSFNLVTGVNEPEDILRAISGYAGEQITLDYDLNENTVIINESTEYYINDTDLIVDVILSIYEYAKTQVELEDESLNEENDDIEAISNQDESDYEIKIAELVESPTDVKEEITQTEIPTITVGQPMTEEVLAELEAEKTNPDNYLSYKGSSVIELFAYDVNNYSMVDFNVLSKDDKDNINIIDALNSYESKTPSDYAYFIKTQNFETGEIEKHYVFLDESNEILLTQCKNKINDGVDYASWTTHMSEENVTSVKISNLSGTVDITDTKTAQQVANMLKGNLSVKSLTSVSDGKNFMIPSSDYALVYITFNNGVEYHIQLIYGKLQIYTTDLDKTLTYELYSDIYDTVNHILDGYL